MANYKNKLQELFQPLGTQFMPVYDARPERIGPPHAPRFTTHVTVTWKDQQLREAGEGGKKKEAEQEAAMKMYRRINPGAAPDFPTTPSNPQVPRGGVASGQGVAGPSPLGDFASPSSPSSYKGQLQEWLQKNGCPVPAYDVVSTTGPPNNRCFTRRCLAKNLSGHVMASESGTAKTVKEAEGMAAMRVFQRLEREGDGLVFQRNPLPHRLQHPPPEIIDPELDVAYRVALTLFQPRTLFRKGEEDQQLCLMTATAGCDYPVTAQGLGPSESVAKRAAACNLVANLNDLGYTVTAINNALCFLAGHSGMNVEGRRAGPRPPEDELAMSTGYVRIDVNGSAHLRRGGPWRDCCWRALWDVAAMVGLGAVLLGCTLAQDAGHVVRRGFFCGDEGVRLPFHEDTVPTWALMLASFSIPVLAMLLGNLFECHVCQRPAQRLELLRTRVRLPGWLVRFGFQLRWFVLGALASSAVVECAKIVAGRLRPNFLSVCNPDFALLNCTDAYGLPLYVTNYTCRADPHHVTAARLSWPSGHASLSSYAFTFTALYIASVDVLPSYSRPGLHLLLVFLSLLLALLTSLSRISDHKHHATDVISGAVIGAVMAVFIVYYNLHFFGWHRGQPNCKQKPPARGASGARGEVEGEVDTRAATSMSANADPLSVEEEHEEEKEEEEEDGT